MTEMKVLVTGVAGLIGSKFADCLINHHPQVTVIGIDDLSGGYIENVNPKIIMYTRNLIHDELDDIFEKHKFCYVFHFSAYAAEGLSPFIRTFNYKNNVVASARLISKSIEYGVKRFVFTSSIAVYGEGSPPFSETDKPNPVDPYGIAKYAVEMDLRVAYKQHGLEFCIIRPHNVYGDKQNIWDKYRNVVGIWMYSLLNNKPITIYGDGEQKRAFTFINDILEPLWNAAILENSNAEIVNLGSPEEFTINQAAEFLLEIAGYGTKVYLPARHEVKYAWCSHKKSEDLLGYRHKTSLQSGLSKMWQWAKQQPKRVPMVWAEYELNKGIYSYWKNQ